VTDNHVVAAMPEQHVKVDGMQVVMFDGKAYEGKVVAVDTARRGLHARSLTAFLSEQ
jgi:hypothetical protein